MRQSPPITAQRPEHHHRPAYIPTPKSSTEWARMSLPPDHGAHGEPQDKRIERDILRKLDLTLIPMLWSLFVVSFADRSNIGNAKIQGMQTDLHLTGNKYNIAVLVFTVAYVAFGVPANVAFRVLGPRSLAAMMLLWGICALCQGLVQTWGGLVACRFLMGGFEAGFVPGCAYLIGSYYTRNEFLKRYSLFLSGSIIAGAFNGLFSGLLARADGKGGLRGWRWIFVVEGLITCVAAIVSAFIIPQFPEDTRLFRGEEKAVLLERLRQDGAEEEHADLWHEVKEALIDPKIWLATIAYVGIEENSASIVAFLPSILQGFGYTATSAQWHSIPVYAVAFILSLLCAYVSERLQQRYLFAMLGALLNLVGLAILLARPDSAAVRYAGAFFMTAGVYIAMPIVVVWNAINVRKGYKRVVSFAMSTAVGNCGALVASNVFIAREEPAYPTGFTTGMCMNCMSILALTALYIGLRIGNDRKARSDVSGEDSQGERHKPSAYQL
ncbi:vitamin h [Lecanosticta acicola]|uniref:Vitamin h n=1 Tax=Lecanosticta acicola TaxID=111012 RepID=A0AAI8YSY8_9PEZI|nr:vitamin h [Lecanosticta acicola]